MSKYIQKLTNEQNLRISITLFIIGVILIIAGLVVGIADNPPGILLTFGGIFFLFFSLIHFWQNPKSYLWLFIISLAGGIIFAILHNLFHALGIFYEQIGIVKQLFEGLDVISFLIAVLICPVGIVIGFLGMILTYFLGRNKKTATK